MYCFSIILLIAFVALCSAKIVHVEQKGSAQLFRSGAKIIPGEDGCQFLPEIVFVQDISTSFDDDMKNMAKVMPDLFEFFNSEYEGKVRFSIVSFVDKNVAPFGFDSDFCAHVDMPLTPFTDESAIQKAQDVFSNLFVAGGNDWLEGANEALYRAASSSQVGWSSETHDPETGFPILRILVLVSDAAVHEASFHAQKANLTLPDFDLESNQDALDADINFGCDDMDYPTPEDIRYALKKRNIVPIILTGVNYRWTPKGRKLMKQFTELMTLHGEESGPWADFDTGLASYYESFLKDQVKMEGVVQIIDNSSSNFIEVFKAAMSQVSDMTCIPITTTTEEPITSSTEEYIPIPTIPQPTRPPRPTTEAVTTKLPATTKHTKPTTTKLTKPTTTAEPTTPTTTKHTTKRTTTKLTKPSSTKFTKPTTTKHAEPTTTDATGVEGTSTPLEAETTTGASDGDNSSTTPSEGTTTSNEETTSGAGGGAGVIIGGAAGGAAAGVAAAGALAAKKFGLAGFGGSATPDATILQDVENVEVTQDREQFEDVTGDLFT